MIIEATHELLNREWFLSLWVGGKCVTLAKLKNPIFLIHTRQIYLKYTKTVYILGGYTEEIINGWAIDILCEITNRKNEML